MKKLLYFICKMRGRHANAVMEFHGAKASVGEDGYIGEQSIAVYKASCPLCGYSQLIGEDEIAQDVREALEVTGKYKDVVRMK